jgi:hypothetical protein
MTMRVRNGLQIMGVHRKVDCMLLDAAVFDRLKVFVRKCVKNDC